MRSGTPIRLAAAALMFLARTAVADNKSAGDLTLLGDSPEFSSASLGAAGGGYALDGAFAGVAHSSATDGIVWLESGFYSRMAGTPSAPGYGGTSTGSYSLAWSAADPEGTLYELFVSTWEQGGGYMDYYSTDQNGYPVASLEPNTSFYNLVYADYMDGDYSAPAATTAVTLAVAPSSGPFTLRDAGHNTLALDFGGFENPDSVGTPQWAAGAAMPAARYGQASVVCGSYVYVSGGFNGVAFSSAVYRASYGTDGSLSAWQPAGYLPAARYGHQLAASRGRVYLIGGYDQAGSHAEVWSADVSSSGTFGAWAPETPLPVSLYFHAAAVTAGKIYVSGGYSSGSGVQGAVYHAHIDDDGRLGTWDPAGGLPAPRYSHTMTPLADRLYVAGGKDGASARSEVWALQLDERGDPAGSVFDHPALPAARFGHTAAAVGNVLYIIGGSNGAAAQQQVFRSRVPAVLGGPARWESGGLLPDARQFQSAELLSGRLYVFGGYSGSSPRPETYSAYIPGTQYLVEVSTFADFSAMVASSGWRSGPRWDAGETAPGLQYYFRAKARNWAGVETAYSAAGSTVTYSAMPSTAPWTAVGVSSAAANWLTNGNPAGYTYELVYDDSPDYLHSTIVDTTYSSAVITGLLPTTTYYARVMVANPFGRNTRYVDLPPVRTGFDPALDISSPTHSDNQPDFADWKSTNTFLCDVDFQDAGGSGLARFELQVATDPGGASGVVAAWAPAVTNIDQDSYTADWTLPQWTWEQLPEAASGYVSARVYDNSGNYSEFTDLFSLIKDTTPPAITVTYSTPSVWYTEYPGDVEGLQFSDGLSGLARVQYSVSAARLFADGGVIGWTDLPLTPGVTSYSPVVTYSFSQLANAASNYFSFRAVDLAGSTRTVVDAFGIGKNVSGPVVTISTPALPVLSTFTLVSGNAYPTNGHAVLGTEVSIKDGVTGLYYDGTSFLAGSRSWRDAEDAASTFTITLANLPLVSGRQYQAVARSSDASGDYSQVFATCTFVFDSQPPSAAVVYPADGSTAYSAGSISGTAADPGSGITAVQVSLRRLSDGKWWKNSLSSWDAAPEPLQAGTTPYWTWNFNTYLRDSLADGASYYATVRAADAAYPKNYGDFYAAGSTFTYEDATPPPATLTLAAAPGSFSGAVALSWRTSGDNAYNGYLLSGSYKVAYSTFSGAQVSTGAAQLTLSTATLTAGSTQTAVVTGLDPSASYYFTLWTADDALNWSPPSNEASAVSGAPDSGALAGRITDASGNPVTGVLVEALSGSGAVEGSDYTDVYGNYSIPGLNSLYLTVRAVWSAQDIESSVSKDRVPNGSAGVNFSLSVSYQLASVTGFIPTGLRARPQARPAGLYTTREVNARTAGAFVEIYRKGRRIGAALAAEDGSFSITNLLPGTYSLRVYNGADYSVMRTVTLRPGENLVFTPKWTLNKDKVYAYPNPAGALVNFHFLPFSASFEAEVQVFDVAGRLVKRLTAVSDDSVVEPGGRKLVWDLAGEGIASGVYLYVLRVRDAAGGDSARTVKKFAVIR